MIDLRLSSIAPSPPGDGQAALRPGNFDRGESFTQVLTQLKSAVDEIDQLREKAYEKVLEQAHGRGGGPSGPRDLAVGRMALGPPSIGKNGALMDAPTLTLPDPETQAASANKAASAQEEEDPLLAKVNKGEIILLQQTSSLYRLSAPDKHGAADIGSQNVLGAGGEGPNASIIEEALKYILENLKKDKEENSWQKVAEIAAKT
jgi:hypothetical protein